MPTTRSQSSSASAGSTSGSASPPSLNLGAVAPLHETETVDSSSGVGAVAPRIESEITLPGALTAPLDNSLSRLGDSAVLHAKEAKALQDATSGALAQVWRDARTQTTALAQRINEGNTSLSRKLNESFTAVGSRLDSLPAVAMLGQDTTPKVSPFSGSVEDGPQFSVWLRRLDDVIRMRPSPLTSEQKANFLIGHLDGVAREKVEDLDEASRKDFDAVANHLKAFFESPQQKYVARQKLSVCRQEVGESASTFANRVLNLVRAATAGQDPQTQKDRVLEELVARLRGDIRYFVKLDNPATFEQAVTKAQTVEQLLSEATAERLIHPGETEVSVNVLDKGEPVRTQVAQRPNARNIFQGKPTNDRSRQPFQGNSPRPRRAEPSPSEPPRCYNCSGFGHIASQCPSPYNISLPSKRVIFHRQFDAVKRDASGQRGNAQLMACDPYSSSSVSTTPSSMSSSSSPYPNSSPEVSRMADLSLTVDKTQDELDQCKSRIAALLKRNEELAHAAFEHNSSSQSSSSGSVIPDVRLLFMCSLAFACVAFSEASADAWLCPSDNPTNLFFVPSSYNCSWLWPNSTRQLQALTLHVYRPNTKRYDSPAVLCKIVRHSVTYSVSLIGYRSQEHKETLLPVSVEECRLMSRNKRCVHGELSQHGTIWRSTNDLHFEFPSAPFGCCKSHSAVTHNCYLLNTVVHARHDGDTLESAAGDMSACLYKDGSCLLSDGSVVIWTPNLEEECRYISVSKMSEIRLPVLAIQAAYGTGKTVVGALIAAQTYNSFKKRVIATTITNNAVAQFTDTLLGLDDFRHLDVLRYVSDSALVEGAPQTPIDLHNILKRLPEDFGHLLSQSAMDTCIRYKKGRELLERFLFNNDLAVELSDAEETSIASLKGICLTSLVTP